MSLKEKILYLLLFFFQIELPIFYRHKFGGTFKLGNFFKTYLKVVFINHSGYFVDILTLIEIHKMFIQLPETEKHREKSTLNLCYPYVKQKMFTLRKILIVKDSSLN